MHKLKLDDFNWLGLNHEAVAKRYGVEYVGTFCIFSEYQPTAVYYCPNPDRSKGHKDYLLLNKDLVLHRMYVRGMDRKEIERFRLQPGVRCHGCNDVIYSVMRHDNRYCKCGAVSIDGGRDYIRVGWKLSPSDHTPVLVDLLSGTATDHKSTEVSDANG